LNTSGDGRNQLKSSPDGGVPTKQSQPVYSSLVSSKPGMRPSQTQ